ncbi:MAG TPA: hypothetical protein VNN10_10755 [Dehalococcoidia bacterium]|nr:hypothetical protein [Dehalococcoidia bacterium]
MSERDDDEAEDDDDPNDPWHRDFDLSEAGGPAYHYEVSPKPWYLRRWFLLLVAVLVVASLVLPLIPR